MNTITAVNSALALSYEWIRKEAEVLADSPFTYPTANGGIHPMWIIGHLTYSRAELLAMISGQTNPYESWKDLFSGGTVAQQEATLYPPFAVVLEAYSEIHQATLELLNETGESGLDAAPTTVWPELIDDPDFQSKGRLFVFIAMHDMSHRGQLADARWALGRK